MIDLYFDIETIPDQAPDALEIIQDGLKAPAQYKKPDSIAEWHKTKGAEAAAEKHAKTALQGISGEICSIAWALGQNPVKGIIRRPGDPEATLLSDFFLSVMAENEELTKNEHFTPPHPKFRWVGHNVIEFDLRFLKQRCWINNVQSPFMIPADAKHGGDFVFDTMREWAGWKGYVSQDALCKAFGLDGKPGMSGADVWPYYQAGRYTEILDYNKDDVRAVREIKEMMF